MHRVGQGHFKAQNRASLIRLAATLFDKARVPVYNGALVCLEPSELSPLHMIELELLVLVL